MKLRIGIVGAGGFAAFAANAFTQTEGVDIMAVHDINHHAAQTLARETGAVVSDDFGKLLSDETIDLVYIATPPYLHFSQSKEALLAGKHVICEKPAALHAEEAEELDALATQKNLLYIVNLMQRYNPLYRFVSTVIEENILGSFLHGFFENYAGDEFLKADHWFWEIEKSGGIFIEHGVHFFDMFRGWLGDGRVVGAIELQRPGTGDSLTDRVQATVLYKDGLVNFYHGFDQPKALDRQELRLEFERGDMTLYEWVPVKIKLRGLLQNDTLARLQQLLPGAVIHHHQPEDDYKATGRFKEIKYSHHITLKYSDTKNKEHRYRQLLSDMIRDQWAWIRDRSHQRVIDSSNAVTSLQTAETAVRMAKKTGINE